MAITASTTYEDEATEVLRWWRRRTSSSPGARRGCLAPRPRGATTCASSPTSPPSLLGGGVPRRRHGHMASLELRMAAIAFIIYFLALDAFVGASGAVVVDCYSKPAAESSGEAVGDVVAQLAGDVAAALHNGGGGGSCPCWTLRPSVMSAPKAQLIAAPIYGSHQREGERRDTSWPSCLRCRTIAGGAGGDADDTMANLPLPVIARRTNSALRWGPATNGHVNAITWFSCSSAGQKATYMLRVSIWKPRTTLSSSLHLLFIFLLVFIFFYFLIWVTTHTAIGIQFLYLSDRVVCNLQPPVLESPVPVRQLLLWYRVDVSAFIWVSGLSLLCLRQRDQHHPSVVGKFLHRRLHRPSANRRNARSVQLGACVFDASAYTSRRQNHPPHAIDAAVLFSGLRTLMYLGLFRRTSV